MASDFKVAYSAGRHAYMNTTRTLRWIVPCAAILVAIVTRAFTTHWYAITAVEIVLVVLPFAVFVNSRQRN